MGITAISLGPDMSYVGNHVSSSENNVLVTCHILVQHQELSGVPDFSECARPNCGYK
jgi:hypothetical protein